MNAPQWRIWLVTALVCGWAILALRFVQKGDLIMAGLCAALLVVNAVTLWRLTKSRKDRDG